LLDEQGNTHSGRANGTDVVEACASAYLAAVNSRLLTEAAARGDRDSVDLRAPVLSFDGCDWVPMNREQ
jgi:hypothetical protein